MSIETVPVPRLTDEERTTIDELGYKRDGIIHVSACYGYMERPNIPAALRLLDPAQTEGHIDVDTASYFLSKLELTAGDEPDDGAIGASDCSSRRPTSPPTPPRISACRSTGP